MNEIDKLKIALFDLHNEIQIKNNMYNQGMTQLQKLTSEEESRTPEVPIVKNNKK